LAAVLLSSLGFLFAGIVAAVVLWIRSGELRAGALALCLTLLAARQGVAVWLLWDAPFAWDVGGLAEGALLAASVVACGAVAGLWHSLAERDRAESQHWDSMEAVRLLSELAVRWDLALAEKFDRLLEIGCARFDLPLGVISRVTGDRYEVLAIRAPEGFAVTRGDVFPLDDTWCQRTLRSNRPLGLENVAEAAPLEDAGREPLGLAAYLGACVRVYGEVTGTVAFGGLEPRSGRFTAAEKDFAHLIAQWIGTELERQLAAEERRRETAAPAPRSVRREARAGTSPDVNAAIRRAEAGLRTRVGSAATLVYALASDLERTDPLPLHGGAIVEILALAALEAMPEGGEIRVRSESPAPRAPASLAPDTPPAFVTLAVAGTGAAVRDDAVTEAFESPPVRRIAPEVAGLHAPLSVGELRRLLLRHGGDLSLAVEPGRSIAFTAWLPCATSAAVTARSAAPPTPPA